MKLPGYKRVYQDLIKRIQDQQLAVGDKLPTEQALADEYDVSKMVGKQALDLLVDAKMVKRVRGKGTFLINAQPAADKVSGPRVGCIFTDLGPYASGLLQGIEQRLSRDGSELILKLTNGSAALEAQYIQQLSAVTDGLIVLPAHGQILNKELLKLVAKGFPVVLIDRTLREIPAIYVSTDNVQAGRALTQRLIMHGRKNIALITPPWHETSTIEERVAGYRMALADNLLPQADAFFLHGLTSVVPGHQQTAEIEADLSTIKAFLLEHKDELEAVVAAQVNLLRLVRRAIQELDEPKLNTLELACFDEPVSIFEPNARYLHVAQQEQKMGSLAADKVLALIKGDAVTSELVPGILVEQGAEGVGANLARD